MAEVEVGLDHTRMSTTRGRRITDTHIHRNSDFLVVMISVGFTQARPNYKYSGHNISQSTKLTSSAMRARPSLSE